ncbi:cadmium resistance transporter [Dermatobacter hominis]|uniref:cadmium resistance transporter n=1 Tax=Dermatobacter hominis TaxID=2884263 RepID=UPI001D10297B|nr:cadmium resistance transporter [Dermatobacter hominis]UDY38108.1 cadmium resistance transporter [Dermatobacter hominis]
MLGQAIAMFAVTNIDDIVLLALFFGRAAGDPALERHIVIGQYAGFAAIIAVSVVGAFGLQFLPDDAIAYLGLVPIALGIRAAVQTWSARGDADDVAAPPALGAGAIAGITFANGGDNIGIYVPVFTAAGVGGMGVYVAVFLVLVAAWLVAGRWLAARPSIARALSRWGHVLLPVVLVSIGVAILVDGGAFGL